ncbi:hypothetical protein TNIN_82631, partial [Trichonephila inaurata madagascariensis]
MNRRAGAGPLLCLLIPFSGVPVMLYDVGQKGYRTLCILNMRGKEGFECVSSINRKVQEDSFV